MVDVLLSVWAAIGAFILGIIFLVIKAWVRKVAKEVAQEVIRVENRDQWKFIGERIEIRLAKLTKDPLENLRKRELDCAKYVGMVSKTKEYIDSETFIDDIVKRIKNKQV
jgi:hypothetical protein